MVTVYGIPNCDVIKKARTWLNAEGIEHRFHDFRSAGIDAERIKAWLRQVPMDKLLNRASTTFKELTEQEKESTAKKPAAIALMIQHPTLIKRPVLEDESGRVLALGFKPDIYQEIFSQS